MFHACRVRTLTVRRLCWACHLLLASLARSKSGKNTGHALVCKAGSLLNQSPLTYIKCRSFRSCATWVKHKLVNDDRAAESFLPFYDFLLFSNLKSKLERRSQVETVRSASPPECGPQLTFPTDETEECSSGRRKRRSCAGGIFIAKFFFLGGGGFWLDKKKFEQWL